MIPGALANVTVMCSMRSGSSGGVVEVKPGTCGGRRTTVYYFCAPTITSVIAEYGRDVEVERNELTLHAHRGNAKDCFVPFGMNSSPRSARTPGSPVPIIPSLPDPTSAPAPSPASCGQNTPFATLVTNVLLLRRRPPSSAAEPIAKVRSRCRRRAVTNRSRACTSVPRSVRSRGTGELLAYENWVVACQNFTGDASKGANKSHTGVATASCAPSWLSGVGARLKDHSPCIARSRRAR